MGDINTVEKCIRYLEGLKEADIEELKLTVHPVGITKPTRWDISAEYIEESKFKGVFVGYLKSEKELQIFFNQSDTDHKYNYPPHIQK